MTKPLSPLWWLYIPILLILIQIGLEVSFPSSILAPMHSEGGPHEALEFLLVAPACIMCAVLFLKADDRLERIWFGLAFLACFYIAGEEISWGQHIFGWITPEFWTEVNDQQETNLHNTSAWLDQKPRLILFIGIVVSGLIAPALRRWRPAAYEKAVPVPYRKYFPSHIVVPVAFGVLLPYLAQVIGKHIFGIHLFERVSEVQEIYMYYFLLLYTLDYKIRKNITNSYK